MLEDGLCAVANDMRTVEHISKPVYQNDSDMSVVEAVFLIKVEKEDLHPSSATTTCIFSSRILVIAPIACSNMRLRSLPGTGGACVQDILQEKEREG